MALIRWFFSLFNSNSSTKDKRAVLIFELNKLQVFGFQTPAQVANKSPHTIIYWQEKESKNTYGPFDSVHNAMKHYTWLVNTQNDKTSTEAPIIYVDFRNKNRIEFK